MSQQTPQDYVNQFNESAQKMFEPWTKLNQAFLKNAEMMTEFSLNTIKTYAEMGLENMRQVSEIDSPEAAKDFSSKQAEMLNTISQKMLSDAQRMTELGSNMHDDVMKVLGEVQGQTSEQMQSSMQKTADQATKKGQEYAANMNKMAEQFTEQATKAAKTATGANTKSGAKTNTNTNSNTSNTKTSTKTGTSNTSSTGKSTNK
ncbi:phasin family protein [Psychrobacter sp. 1U2]